MSAVTDERADSASRGAYWLGVCRLAVARRPDAATGSAPVRRTRAASVACLRRSMRSTAGVRRVRFHDLRHTHATLLLKAGTPVKVVSERLGHASPAFTLTVYAHVLPGQQSEAASAFAALVGS